MLRAVVADKRARLKQRPGGRFPPSVIADRMDGLRELAGVEPKDIGGHLWPNQTPENAARSWWRRTSDKPRPFTLAEIERALEYLIPRALKRGKLQGSGVLPGFPFVDLYVALALERGETPPRPTHGA